jgi:hypothetical protein
VKEGEKNGGYNVPRAERNLDVRSVSFLAMNAITMSKQSYDTNLRSIMQHPWPSNSVERSSNHLAHSNASWLEQVSTVSLALERPRNNNMTHHLDGRSLKQQIKQAGYTLDEFHKELGIAKTTFYYYRTGARPVPYKLRQRIEELLQCSFHEFVITELENNLIILPVEQSRRSGQRAIT